MRTEVTDELLDVIPPVPQAAFARLPLAVDVLEGLDLGDVGQAGEHTHAVDIPQAPVDAVLLKEGVGDEVVLHAQVFLGGGVVFDGAVDHGASPPTFSASCCRIPSNWAISPMRCKKRSSPNALTTRWW